MLEPLFHKGCIFAACFRFAKAKLPKYDESLSRTRRLDGGQSLTNQTSFYTSACCGLLVNAVIGVDDMLKTAY